MTMSSTSWSLSNEGANWVIHQYHTPMWVVSLPAGMVQYRLQSRQLIDGSGIDTMGYGRVKTATNQNGDRTKQRQVKTASVANLAILSLELESF